MDFIGVTEGQELLNYAECLNELGGVQDINTCLDQGADYEYTVATNKLYKIWFNENPDVLLSEKNTMRLQKFRDDNPCSQISLVYSRELISSETEKEMNKFFEEYKIIGVDFDDLVAKALNNGVFPEIELSLLSLAKEEIYNLGDRNNGGGNAAAAADILRFCPSIISALGIYSDFDVHLEFNKIQMGVVSPMIIPSNNNDFVAFAIDSTGQGINKNALEEIYKVQKAILDKYQTYNSQDSEFNLKEFSNKHNLISILFNKAMQENKVWSVLEYRSQIKNLDIYDILDLIYNNYDEYLSDNFFYGPVHKQKLSFNVELLQSSRELSLVDAEGLFCDIQKYSIFHDIDAVSVLGLRSIIKIISNNIDDYSQISGDFKNYVLNYENLSRSYLESNLQEFTKLYERTIHRNDANYCHIVSVIKVLAEKNLFYKRSVESFSGPQILHKLYDYKERKSFAPETNKIDGITRDGQDASWYLKFI